MTIESKVIYSPAKILNQQEVVEIHWFIPIFNSILEEIVVERFDLDIIPQSLPEYIISLGANPTIEEIVEMCINMGYVDPTE